MPRDQTPVDDPNRLPTASASQTARITRRHAGLCLAALAWPAAAQQRRPTDPLRLGVDAVLDASGFARRLLAALGHDTGFPVAATFGDPSALLTAIDRGELDAVLSGLPAQEELMERKGLVHDRRLVARNEYVIAGPGGRKGDPAGVRGLNDLAQALARIAEAGTRGVCSFVSAGSGGGVQAAEAALWKAAGPQAFGAWYLKGGAGAADAVAQARQQGAYVLVERGVWAAAGKGLEVLAQGDARAAAAYHVMRSFRVNHPGGKLMVGWFTGAAGRAAVTKFGAGYTPAPKA